jgi:hypothetical protein
MKYAMIIAAMGALLTVATPALAEPPTSGSLDLDLKLGWSSFRLGGRLLGPHGYAGGVWLNGETRRDGFRLDGGFERDGKLHQFKFNADVDEWLRRATRSDAIDL